MGLLSSCFTCWGRGYKIVPGKPYTREELRTLPELKSIYADILVNGGWAAPSVRVTCPKCNGTGKRK